MTPQDATGQRVGPGKDDAVIWALRDGTFEHVFQKQPAPVFADGTYQRVVLYRKNQRPTLQIKAEKVLFKPIDIRRAITEGC